MWNLQSSSKIIKQIQQQKNYQLHKQRLKSIKSIIKIKQPEQPTFIYAKYKLQMSRRQRLKQIDQKNNILLKKMNKIFLQKDLQDQLKPQSKWLKSLNQSIQTHLNIKINKQNQKICSKLMDAKSFYPACSIIKNTQKLNQISLRISQNARRLNKSVKQLKYRPSSASTTNLLYKSRQNRQQNLLNINKHTEKYQNYSSKTRPQSAPSKRVASLQKTKNKLKQFKQQYLEYEPI